MPYVRSLTEITLDDQSSVGEKATHLGELIRAGFDAPRGICITADAYREAINARGIGEKISARIKATEIEDPVELEDCAEEVRAWIESAPMPAALEQELRAALEPLDAQSFAVRASRVVADVPNPAASGLQQAYLAVPASALFDHIRKCWATPWNSRAIYFRNRKKMDQASVTMAVVIQPMLCADAAGVLFTANPLTGAAEEIHIDATWGLGAAVIAARWKPDHFVVEKQTLAIRERVIASKSVMDVAAPEGGIQTVGVAAEKQDAASLTDAQIAALAALGERVETHFGAPQDVEWCRIGNEIFPLQTRALRR
jgi:pyruvate,water dikinase